MQHPPFRCLYFRFFSVLTRKNSRTCRSPTGLHGAITLATQVIFGFEHKIVFNSYNLVRVPTSATQTLCHSHGNRTTQRHQAPRPARSCHSVLLSLIFPVGLTRNVPTQTCHCALCLQQHTTLSPQMLPRNSPSGRFCSCVLPNTPSGAQFHSDFMKTSVKHRPPATQETRWQSRSHLLRRLHTVPLSQMLPPNSPSQSSFLGASAPMTRWIDSLFSPRKGTLVGAPSPCQARGCHSQYQQCQWW